MLARELVSKSYYLSNVVSKELQTVEPSQITEGMALLNSLLSEKSATGNFIPYYNNIEVVPVIGQEEYFIPDLIQLDIITFNIRNVRYTMSARSRYNYWGGPKINNINSLPFEYYYEKVNGGTRFFVYFSPSSSIDFFTIVGKFALSSVTLDDELSDFLDGYYQAYLKYLLANELALEYDLEFSQRKEKRLNELMHKCRNINPMDLTMRKISTLSNQYEFVNYAYANLGNGFVP